MSFIIDPVTFLAEWLSELLLGFGLSADFAQFILYMIGAFILAVAPMMMTVFLIWGERKILGRIQDRFGPNRVGPWGIFQTFADMVKIFTKEYITPSGVDWWPYNLAPILAMGAVLMLWAVIPISSTLYGVNINVGVVYLVAVGGIGTLGIILAGWGSDNKYALLGAFRAVAQMLSYEVPLVISLLVPVMLSGSMGMNDIVYAQDVWFIFLAPVPALIFFISSIAEVGRSPFDLLEAESEIVAGFNIEYSGLKFGMFYVGDFLHAFTTAVLFTTLFLGGWRGPGAVDYPILGVFWLILKTLPIWFLGILIRGSLPRFRMDQLMNLNWKFLTPLALAMVIVTAVVDKLIPHGGTLSINIIRTAALLLANILIWVIADRLMKAVRSRRHIPTVSDPYQEIEGVVNVNNDRLRTGSV
jgi:NADH-quinone oxidoreductase subunit H